MIVPVYNVESYVERCLRSVLDQSFLRLEVIVVDDGSPDGSMSIVRAIARRDRRVRVVVQANAGLGAARNTGVKHARGRYLTFVDSDDWITPGAYLAMVRTLERTGSDFVIGAMQREQGRRTWVSKWVRRFHARDRFGLRLDDDPDALKDIFAWNKVFRRDFFERVIGAFPEGIRYEDQEPITRALLRSTAFDVLEKIVYTWVSRDDGSSITQQKLKIEDISDRISVMRSVERALVDEASDEIYREWLVKTIGMDLVPYFEALPRTNDPRYVSIAVEAVSTYAAKLKPEDWCGVPVMNRLLALAAWRGSVDDVVAVLRSRQEDGHGYHLRADGERFFAELDVLDRLSFDVGAEFLEVASRDLKLHPVLTHVRWVDDSTVELRGHARVQGVDLEAHPMDLRCELRALRGEPGAVDVPLERLHDVTLDERSGDAYNSYAGSSFRARLSLEDASPLLESRGDAAVYMIATVRGHRFVEPFQTAEASYDGDALPRTTATEHGARLLSFVPESGLVLRPIGEPGLELVRAVRRGRDVELHVRGPKLDRVICEAGGAIARTSARRVRGAADGGRVFRLRLPEAPRLKAERPLLWTIRGVEAGRRVPLVFAGGARALEELSGDDERLRFSVDEQGGLGILENRVRVIIDAVDLSDDERSLFVEGRADPGAEDELELKLIGARRSISGRGRSKLSSGPFRVEFPLTERRPGEDEAPVRPGGFGIYAIPCAEGETRYGALPSRNLREHLPRDEARSTFRVRVRRRFKAGMCWVDLRPPQKLGELGRYARRSFRVELERRPRALREATLFESYGGTSVGCSPGALLDYARKHGLGGELYASVAHAGVKVPEGVKPVIVHSREYFDVIHAAKTLINNNNFPHYFRKQPGQRYVQTWHGTPLKRIGNHVPVTNLSFSYRELMKREARWWDVLLAQNEYSAGIFPGAFGYDGQIIVEGYPRNDLLVAERCARDTIRRRLGIAPEQYVLLYAPTWRDNVKARDGRYDFVSFLDVDRLVERSGEDLVVLQRGHVNTSLSVKLSENDRVVDVTQYPNVSELMIAADCLVTDYSSIMFDFSVLDRPIYLLAPDLDEYMSSIRGFYFDIRENAPGFIGRTSEEIGDQISSLRAGEVDEFANERRRFRSEFSVHDDGASAERVAKAVWS